MGRSGSESRPSSQVSAGADKEDRARNEDLNGNDESRRRLRAHGSPSPASSLAERVECPPLVGTVRTPSSHLLANHSCQRERKRITALFRVSAGLGGWERNATFTPSRRSSFATIRPPAYLSDIAGCQAGPSPSKPLRFQKDPTQKGPTDVDAKKRSRPKKKRNPKRK